MQGGLIGPLSARFKESDLLVAFLVFSWAGLTGWALAPTVPFLLAAMLPLAIGAGSFNALINSAISKSVSREEVGGMLGLGSGLESFTRVVMPAFASYLLGAYGTSVPGWMASSVMAFVVMLAYLRLISRPDPVVRGEDTPVKR